MLNARQFSPPQGDESARKALIKQLRKDFPEPALAWLDSPDVQVDQPQRIPADQIDWDGYPRWRASRQLEAVVEIAKKKIHKKKGKPSAYILPVSTLRITGLPRRAPTFRAVSTSFDK